MNKRLLLICQILPLYNLNFVKIVKVSSSLYIVAIFELLFISYIIFPIIMESQVFFPILWKNIIMENKSTFGEKLKELRLERGLGQVALAKELDVGKSVISLWELNKCEPTLSKLIAIAKFFGVSIDWLAGLEE